MNLNWLFKFGGVEQVSRQRPDHFGKVSAAPRHNAEPKQEHKFPCTGCGASLEFAPGTTDLKCPYCGTTKHIPQTAEEVVERDYKAYFRNIRALPEALTAAPMEVKCTNCGAMAEIAGNVSSDCCPFCNVPIVNPPSRSDSYFTPEAVLPFAIQSREAIDLFDKWVKSRWFAPNNLQKMARLGRVTGVYIPHWTYDSYTSTFYTGQRGDHYWETSTDSKGNTRRTRHTRWSYASGNVTYWFDDVLVCTSKGLPEKYVRELEPWDLKNLRAHTPEVLAGFRVERYQIDAENGFEKAKEYMKPTIEARIRRDIGGDEQRITSMNTSYDGISFKHILLPVWISAFQYNNKTYQILVNARTGEVQGERPWSWIKITLAVLAALAVTGLIYIIADKYG